MVKEQIDIFTYKRLKTLKYLIDQKNYRELDYEVSSFELHDGHCERVARLLHIIRQKNYHKAVSLINSLVNEFEKEDTVYAIRHKDESDIAGLRTMINLYEVQLSVLNFNKADINRKITEFRILHNRKLGALISKILEYRREQLYEQLKDNPDKQQEYEEASQDYEQFHRAYNEQCNEQVDNLTGIELEELQKYYRKASKLCHPDLVSEGSKNEANEVFIELNKAYMSQDTSRVKEILQLLEDGDMVFVGLTETLSEKKKLEQYVTRLKTKISQLQVEIRDLINSDVYQTIIDITDYDHYFDSIRRRLENELELLEQEVSNVSE